MAPRYGTISTGTPWFGLLMMAFVITNVFWLFSSYYNRNDPAMPTCLTVTTTASTDPDLAAVRADYATLKPRSLQGEGPISKSLKTLASRQQKAQTLCNQTASFTETGAWCLFSQTPKAYFAPERELSMNHVGAHARLAEKLAEFFADDSVLDLGAGLGQYGQYWEARLRKGSYAAFDGALNIDTFTDFHVFNADLTQPLHQVSDWVMSLEVGEHIPKQYQDVFVNNLVRNARFGLVLSWAIPGQGGYSHVNELPNEKVIELLQQRSFTYMPGHSQQLRATINRSHWWFKNTLMVFFRTGVTPNNFW